MKDCRLFPAVKSVLAGFTRLPDLLEAVTKGLSCSCPSSTGVRISLRAMPSNCKFFLLLEQHSVFRYGEKKQFITLIAKYRDPTARSQASTSLSCYLKRLSRRVRYGTKNLFVGVIYRLFINSSTFFCTNLLLVIILPRAVSLSAPSKGVYLSSLILSYPF